MRRERPFIACKCHHCNANLSNVHHLNLYSGERFSCGRCGGDVTIDLYGKGYYGYYVVSDYGGNPVFYKHLSDASKMAEMFTAKLFYAHKFYSNPELLKSYSLND